jgi:hypothetical protein
MNIDNIQSFFCQISKILDLYTGADCKSSHQIIVENQGSIHKLWTSLYSTVSDVKKGIVKCRMLTRTYLLQKDKHKFSNGKVQADCVLYCIGDEDIIHMLTQCSALHEIRREQMQILKKTVVEYTCKTTWNCHFINPESITQLILDCTLFRTLFTSSSQLDDIMRKTSDLCYKMHVPIR